MIEVNEDSEESSSNIKKLKFLTEQMGLLRNFFLTKDKNVHSLHHSCLYHQQQNKWYTQRCLLAHFEAKLDFSRREFTCI